MKIKKENQILNSEEGDSDCEDIDDDDQDYDDEDCPIDVSKYKKELDLFDWIEIGDAFFEKGFYYQSIKLYEQVVDENPDLIQIWKKLGHAYVKIGEIDEAFCCYSIANRPVIDIKDLIEQIHDNSENQEEEIDVI